MLTACLIFFKLRAFVSFELPLSVLLVARGVADIRGGLYTILKSEFYLVWKMLTNFDVCLQGAEKSYLLTITGRKLRSGMLDVLVKNWMEQEQE